MDVIICIGRISRYVKGKCHKESRKWKFKICDSRRIFVGLERRI